LAAGIGRKQEGNGGSMIKLENNGRHARSVPDAGGSLATAGRTGTVLGLLGAVALGSVLLVPLPARADCSLGPAPEVMWRRCHLAGYVASGEDLTRATLRESTFNRSDFSNSVMIEVDARRAKFVSADLSGAQLDGANLVQTDLTSADLTGASLRGTDLSRAYLVGAILREADLTGARLDRAELLRADFSGATWVDGRTICAEGSIGRCNPQPASESVGEVGASG
jgi:hypothetical protein